MFKRRSKVPEPALERNAGLVYRQADLSTTSRGDSPPPSYSASAAEGPPPDISTAFANLNLDEASTSAEKARYETSASAQRPTADECLAHLKLLEAFYSLREDISQHDGLFGISDSFATASTERERTEQLAKMREKRWQVYVSKASKRFEAWWGACVLPEARKQSQYSVTTVGQTPWVGGKLVFERQDLPPLDVVMVWHAYQLNPRNFLEDCILFNKMGAWRAGLPWAIINSCIDNDSFDYDAGPQAKQLFDSCTQHRWDSLQDPQLVEIKCPKCGSTKTNAVPWTTWDNQFAWVKNSNGDYRGEHDATGYADKGFTMSCKNSQPSYHLREITHGVLRAQKFRSDCEALKHHDIPMQGTCLDSNGLPEALRGLGGRASFFPNRLILGKPSDEKVFTNIRTATEMTSTNAGTMNNVRTEIEKGFADSEYVEKVNGHKPTKEERIALRHMMSCYWDNASPYSLDLVGAVIRQGTFVEKMHRINWIHSPAARFTMRRLLIKYDCYLEIVANSKGSQLAVPTLDVDLAWHTHQLRPPLYFQHTVSLLNIFLNHDDKIEDLVLSTAFEWTSKTYQRMFNELYSECTCWYCEAVRESYAPALSGLNLRKRFGGKASVIEKQLNQIHSARDEGAEMNHISAHNSIRPDDSSDRTIRERNMRIKLERDYKKAVVKARKQGREPPVRDEYYYSYGYPIYMPVYVPYQGDPCVSEGMYPANPSCATYVPGASGNCAAGTCGGGVAAGACGGGGSCTNAGGCSGGDGGGDGGCGGGCGGCG